MYLITIRIIDGRWGPHDHDLNYFVKITQGAHRSRYVSPVPFDHVLLRRLLICVCVCVCV
jgi:hypothetical protein